MDRPQLLALLEGCHRESFGWALCCCSRSAAQAEEVLQRVYLSVMEGKAQFDGRAAFKTWLFAVIRKTAADERRRDILRRLRLVRYAGRDRADANDDPPDSDMHCGELRDMFLEALGRLPARQRQVLHLVFYHDFTISQAAEAMGVSLGSARTHYDRAKKALRLRLKDTVHDESGHGRRETGGAVLGPEARG